MTSQLFQPRRSLSLLNLPADPLDVKALADLPLRTLESLTDRVYQQLDSEHPSAYTLEWYSALTGEWARRMTDGDRPEEPSGRAGMVDYGSL